ncbi:MAG: TrkA family potassium uptake protein [Atopobiaceae bacterium]|jgi:trk system potassium uptake protein TrkA|nr:TrkA family potassium uptake protein [Atopobiaceae bacterium]
MDVIIVGMGRMGSGLATKLCAQGNHVCVIDRDQEKLDSLPDDFSGTKIAGVGFDRDVLAQAGIDRVSAVIACTASDEANIVVAQIARSVYHVPRVIARLYDMSKAEAYRRLGIQAISTTEWGIARACQLLTYHQLDGVFQMGDGDVEVVRVDLPHLLEGEQVREITALGEVMIVAIMRGNDTFIPTQGTELQHGDVLFAAVASTSARRFKTMLGLTD